MTPAANPLRLPGYEVVRLIGRGGMGEVYEAIRVGPGGFRKSIAVKQLPSDKVIDGASVQRFLQEARISAQLEHPNIVRIHDLVVQDGYFLVMELLRGWTLSEAIKSQVREATTWRTAFEIAEQALAGLAYAHALTDESGEPLGLVHRDLTPRNLFLTESGAVKILDFGLAKLVNALTPGLTEAGHLHGTLGFLAPEQARAEGSDPKSDLYQVGGVIYWLLCNRPPNGTGSAGEVLARAANSRPVPLGELADLPAPVLALVDRAMARSLDDRFADAQQMRSQVQAILRDAGHLRGLQDLTDGLPPVPRAEPMQLVRAATVSDTLMRKEPTAEVPPEAWDRRALPWIWILVALTIAAASGFVASELRRSPLPVPTPLPTPIYHRMTFRPGFVAGARFTPDGRSILYSASWGGAPMETVEKSIDSPEVRTLGLKGSEIVGVADDGRVALLNDAAFHYGYVRRGTLAEASLSGATPRELIVDVQDAEWTPDKQLLVLRWRGTRTTIELPPGTVLHDGGDSRWFGELRLSRDGRKIALTEHPVRYDDRGRVVIFDRDTKELKPLTREFLSLRNIAWGPNDHEVWFSASNKGQSRAIHAVTLEGEVRVLEEIPGSLAVMDVFTDGRALLAQEPQSARIHIGRGGEERDLTWFDFDVVFDMTPDGAALVFCEGGSDAGGAAYGAYLRRTDGSPAILLAQGIPWAISPDGARVVVTTKERDIAQLIPTGAGDHRTVGAKMATIGAVAWFSDNRRVLVASSGDQGDRFFVIDSESLAATELGHRGLHLPLGGNPISPDGKRFAALELTSGRLHLVSIDSDRIEPIEGALPGEHVFRWAPDSQSVLVGRFGDAPLVVTRLELAGGARRSWRTLMPTDPTGVTGIVSAAISSDLDTYAYTATRIHSTLYLVEHLR